MLVLNLKAQNWLMIAGLFFILAVTHYIWLPYLGIAVSRPGGESPAFGVLLGIAIFAMINGMDFGKTDRLQKQMEQEGRTARAARTGTILSILVGALILYTMAVRNGIMEGPQLSKDVNLWMPITMICLSLLLPTDKQGLLTPGGDERYRANKQLAQALTLRWGFAVLLVLAGLASSDALPVPVDLLITTVLFLLVTLYNATLWRLEARDE